jgi:hypothetical protein
VLELFQALKPRFFDLGTRRDYVISAGFEEVGHYYRPPGLPRHKQSWLATVWRKA